MNAEGRLSLQEEKVKIETHLQVRVLLIDVLF